MRYYSNEKQDMEFFTKQYTGFEIRPPNELETLFKLSDKIYKLTIETIIRSYCPLLSISLNVFYFYINNFNR